MIPALRVVVGRDAARATSLQRTENGLRTIVKSPTLLIEATAGVQIHRSGEWQTIVCGDLLGSRSPSGDFAPGASALNDLEEFGSASQLDRLEGRFVIVRVRTDGEAVIFLDRFGGTDLYFRTVDGATWFATSLDLVPMSGVELDPVPLAFALTVYGYRPPKQHTLYKGVRRLGVEQIVRIRDAGAELVDRPFVPVKTSNYGERELHEYSDKLLEAVRIRGSRYGNVVYLSSGWDSTSILACLVHLFGSRRVRAVIGRMRYAERSGVINQFELDRARAVAEFFGVPLDVIEFDYRTGAEQSLEAVRPLFRSQQLASLTGLNHWRLAEHAAKTSGGDEVVFAGEMSDGAHNLGFSQFVTIFHPVIEFREYSDKMLSYLFGPTFLGMFQQNTHEQDPIHAMFRARNGNAIFDQPATGDASRRTMQLLSSFFLRGNRLPLWSLKNGNLLTETGRDSFSSELESVYLERASREATADTLYAWYLHLYNSFHWQGSTVSTLPVTAEAKGLRCALPFHDGEIQDFLSGMPESWGRGLDLKPTKYPLKWMLANRIRYPTHLQVGPHSYTYDVDPNFSHSAEILYGSGFAPVYKKMLKTQRYERWISSDVFDVGYVKGIVGGYVSGQEVRGGEMNDLLALCMLLSTGSYSD